MNASFVEGIQKANTVLLTTPECIELRQNGNAIVWAFTSPAVKKARTALRSVLKDLWGSGAYNYAQFAKALRVDERTIMALIDEQMIEAKNL